MRGNWALPVPEKVPDLRPLPSGILVSFDDREFWMYGDVIHYSYHNPLRDYRPPQLVPGGAHDAAFPNGCEEDDCPKSASGNSLWDKDGRCPDCHDKGMIGPLVCWCAMVDFSSPAQLASYFGLGSLT